MTMGMVMVMVAIIMVMVMGMVAMIMVMLMGMVMMVTVNSEALWGKTSTKR